VSDRGAGGNMDDTLAMVAYTSEAAEQDDASPRTPWDRLSDTEKGDYRRMTHEVAYTVLATVGTHIEGIQAPDRALVSTLYRDGWDDAMNEALRIVGDLAPSPEAE